MTQIIYRPKQIREMFSWSRHAHENAIKHEGFPRPIRLSQRAIGFEKKAVDEWFEGRKADRDQECPEMAEFVHRFDGGEPDEEG